MRLQINNMLLSKQNKAHYDLIKTFLEFLNKKSEIYILKGGTSLMMCYNLNRFSEDIDLDSISGNSFFKIVENFCKNEKLTFRIAKDTTSTKRVMIHYIHEDQERTLKVELSLRNKLIPSELHHKINGINVYKIDIIFNLKLNAFLSRDKIRDLFDLCFIAKNYSEQISDISELRLCDAFKYKGYDRISYIIDEQKDPLIDKEKLSDEVLNLFEKYSLLDEKEPKQKIKHANKTTKNLKM